MLSLGSRLSVAKPLLLELAGQWRWMPDVRPPVCPPPLSVFEDHMLEDLDEFHRAEEKKWDS